MIRFINELRRRHVVRMGLLYVASAFAFLQVSKFFLDLLASPPWIARLLLAVLVLLFPLVLALAWRFELTAEGLKATADTSTGTGTGGHLARRLTLGSVAAVALVIAALIVWRATPVGSNVVDTPAPSVAEADVEAVPIADPRPSVAVLPFQNRSDSATDRYFADGMHDDILTQLAKIAALKVIARTSVEQFRDTRMTTRQIGTELGVRTVLEGGVQRVGDRVRINVQLIDARDDAHLWAETYDRVLTAANVFAIQSEVAAAVAAALATTLTPAEQRRVEAVPTRSLEAWEAYQLGQQRLARRTTESLAEAKTFFERAIDADPRFALAQVGLAETLRLRIGYSGAPRAETLERVAIAVERALVLSPDLPEALVVQAQVAQDRDQLERAEASFRRALQLAPNNARAHQFYSRLLSNQARRDEALHHAERAVALDPLSAIINVNLADVLAAGGRFTAAIARYERAIEIDPELPAAYRNLGMVQAYALGRIDAAVPWFERAVARDPDSPEWSVWLAASYLDLADDEQARLWTRRALQLAPDHVTVHVIASFLELFTGNEARALEHARRTLQIDPTYAGALMLLRNDDLGRGDPATARARYAAAFPALLAESTPTIDGANADAALDLALVLMRTGENTRAEELLAGIERFIAPMPRMNVDGFGIADAQVHAIRGDGGKAITALRTAVSEGWRSDWRYYRDHDPAFESLRKDPQFAAIFREIAADIAAQRARVAATSTATPPMPAPPAR